MGHRRKFPTGGAVSAAAHSWALAIDESCIEAAMKIAQIAPLSESVPPGLYGGTERVVSHLTEELVARGHDVTLFASGDSVTSAGLVPVCEKALRLDPRVKDPIPYHIMMLELLRQRIDEFDVVHFHIDLLHFPLVRACTDRSLTTLHGRLDLPDLQPFYRLFPEIPLVSISNDQRRPMPPVNWLGTIYHGLPLDLLPFKSRGPGYLAFLGRIAPEKRPDLAIEIAVRSGLPLKIAAKVDKVDREYWETAIRPLVEATPSVEYVGEITEREKADFLGDALALVFPVDWPEPFGLAMIEAMSCGTPVVARRRGSIPEVVDRGVSGYIFESIDEAVSSVELAARLDRAAVRRRFEERFSVGRMAEDYLRIYHEMTLPQVTPEQLRLVAEEGVLQNVA